MNQTRQNVMVGLFVLVGLGTVGVMIMAFGQYGTFSWVRKPPYAIEVRFASAAGIKPGTIATIGGITVGRVRSVNFVDPSAFNQGVSVRIEFERDYRLRRGARAATVEPGFGSGRPPIVLYPGDPDGPFLESGERIEGSVSAAAESFLPPQVVSTFDRTATQIGEAAEALTPVLKEMKVLLEQRSPADVDRPGGPAGNISSAAARLDASLKHFNDVLGDPQVQSNLRSAVEDLKQITTDGKAMAADLKSAAAEVKTAASDARNLIAGAQESVRKIDAHVDSVSNGIVQNLEKSSKFLDQLNLMAGSVSRGEGSLGALVTDRKLYDAMVLTFQRFAATVEEFRMVGEEWRKGKIKIAF